MVTANNGLKLTCKEMQRENHMLDGEQLHVQFLQDLLPRIFMFNKHVFGVTVYFSFFENGVV